MKKQNNIFTLLFLIIALFGCSEDFLDRPLLDQENSKNFYQTEVQATEALIAIYDVLQYQSVSTWAPFQYTSDILSDDAYAGGGDANDGFEQDQLNKFNIPSTNGMAHSIFRRNYIGIYRANLYLEIIGDIDASEEFKTRTIAEAKFLRAYFYFELVRLFENVPLVLSTLNDPAEYAQPQSDPVDVYNQIALDLVEAIDGLPTDLPSNEIGRLTKWTAESFIGRVYLFYNGVYGADLVAGGTTIGKSEVLAYSEDVITNSGHDLLENYEDIFRLASEYSVESVFEIGHGDSPAWWDWNYTIGGEGNLAAQLQGPRVTGSTKWNRGWSFAPVSHKLVTDMAGDPRLETTVLFESELDGALVKGFQHTGYFSQKYSSDAEHWGADGQFEHNRTCNYRVIRFSEVLLNAAELGSPNAQVYLDRVRARVGLTSVTVNENNLFNERRMEFALEGHRYFDLLRRGLTIASQELTLTGVRGPNYVGDQVTFDVTFNSATKGFLPIPQVELDLSAGVMTQNAGY